MPIMKWNSAAIIWPCDTELDALWTPQCFTPAFSQQARQNFSHTLAADPLIDCNNPHPAPAEFYRSGGRPRDSRGFEGERGRCMCVIQLCFVPEHRIELAGVRARGAGWERMRVSPVQSLKTKDPNSRLFSSGENSPVRITLLPSSDEKPMECSSSEEAR